jgi:multidrug efflux pump subunit AcrB
MGTIDHIKKMQSEGKTESEISKELSNRGLSQQEISDAISQSNIKQAVGNQTRSQNEASAKAQQVTQELDQNEMQPSMFQNNIPDDGSFSNQSNQQNSPDAQSYSQDSQPYPSNPQSYQQGPQSYSQDTQNYQYYPEYSQYSSALSPDTISEIAEQAVTERIAPLKSQVEKISDARTTLLSKVEHLTDRLERIEKIIDRLQLSLLQKVGDYVNDVSDIKKELVQSQKTFKSIISKSGKGKKHP